MWSYRTNQTDVFERDIPVSNSPSIGLTIEDVDDLQDSLDAKVTTNTLIYRATLSQEDTSAPVATVLENTLSGDVVWTRNVEGIYYGTLTGAYTVNKTFLVMGSIGTLVGPGTATFIRSNSDVVAIATKDASMVASDDMLNSTSVEIQVYT